MSSIRRPLWAMNAAAAVALAVALAVGLGVGVGVAEAQGSAPVSCDAKMGSLLASDDFVDFTSAVKGANLEHIALVEALMEDPEVEVVIEDEVAETEVFDFNEDIDTIRDLCIALEFNQTEANSQGTSLCFSAVSVAPENTTFSPIELTIPVCRPTSCSPDQALVTLSCASANAYLYLPGDARLACEPVAVFCEICSGCFIDQLAEVLNISPDYIVVVLVLLCIVILVSTFVGVSKCRANRALSGGGPVGAGGGSRKSKRKSVSEQYYAQFEVSLQQRKNHHGDGGRTASSGTAAQEAEAQMWKKRITAIYLKHRPTKMDELPSVLSRYRGQEQQLFNVLSRKYDEVV